MWPDGRLSAPSSRSTRQDRRSGRAGLHRGRNAQFFMVEEDGFGPGHPFSGEKLLSGADGLSLRDLDEALEGSSRSSTSRAPATRAASTRGRGARPLVAARLRVARVLVNQAHCFGTGGGFDNGLGFTLTMGAGTWAGNSISENLSYRHFLNITPLARVIPPREPTEDELSGTTSHTTDGEDMDLLEHQGKGLLAQAGLRAPRGVVVSDPTAPPRPPDVGGRGPSEGAGPHRQAWQGRGSALRRRRRGRRSPCEPCSAWRSPATRSTSCSSRRRAIARELYAAVLDDPATKGPLLLFSTRAAWTSRRSTRPTPSGCTAAGRHPPGLKDGATLDLVSDTDLAAEHRPAVAQALEQLYDVYLTADASLVEVNPLVVTDDGQVVALDARSRSTPGRSPASPTSQARPRAVAEERTELERAGARARLPVHRARRRRRRARQRRRADHDHAGRDQPPAGRPANFLEIGGDAYTKATPALELVLSNPRVKSLLVNFCGAFARTDVMAEVV